MDEQDTEVQVVSIHTQILGYHLEASACVAQAREVNDEIASMTCLWPQRFAGMTTSPLQDVAPSITELDRAVNVLGLKGAELDTVVNGKNLESQSFCLCFKRRSQWEQCCSIILNSRITWQWSALPAHTTPIAQA